MSLESYESYDVTNTNTVILNNGDYVAFIDFGSKDMPSGSGKLILENGEWRIDYFKDDKMNTFKFDADKLDKLKHGEIILSNANKYFVKPTTPEHDIFNSRNEGYGANMRESYGGKRSRRRSRRSRKSKSRKSRKSRK